MNENEAQERQRQAREREEELRQIPLAEIDKTKWPRGVREIALKETGGLGIDATGRLHWNGKPVEIVSQRLDLTWAQFIIAVVVALATVFGAAAGIAQAWIAYDQYAASRPTAAPAPIAGNHP